jgi:hypothetical protein
MIGGTRGNPGTGHLEEILISPRVHQTPEAFGFEESVRIPMCQSRLITRCSEAREFREFVARRNRPSRRSIAYLPLSFAPLHQSRLAMDYPRSEHVKCLAG